MKKIIALLTVYFLLLTIFGGTASAVPGKIAYQGLLKDSNGDTLTGSYSMVFSIYSTSTGGSATWTETQTVTAESGLYTVQLGSGTALTSSVFTGSTMYLGIKIGSDSEMTPRVALITVPYAFQAATVADDITVNTSGGITAASFSGDGSALTNIGDATTVDGLNASDFVLKAGDTMTGTLTVSATTDTYAGFFNTDHSSGRAVYGLAAGNEGYGVWGQASATGDYANYGGIFTADGQQGVAVSGIAGADGNYTTYGAMFESKGYTGTGVWGKATATSGTNYGVHGQTASSNGYSGYFTGGKGVKAVGTLETTADLILSSPDSTPSASEDPGSTGMITWDTNYIYIYTGAAWKRVTLEAF